MLSNLKHESYAQLLAMAVLTGQSNIDCYVAIYGDEGKTPEQVSQAAQALACKPTIKNRVQQLGSQAMAKQEKRLEFTLEEALKFCALTVMSRPSEANMDNPLCEIKMSKMGPYAAFADKLGALSLLTKLKGWTQDVNISISVPSWSPTSEENITSPPLEAELVPPLLEE